MNSPLLDPRMKISLANREIGEGCPPYAVAEISGNHNGDLKQALRLIVAAKKAGADSVKFQAYEPDTITLDHPKFVIKDGPWAGRKLYDLYREAHTPFAWFPDLFAVAREIGITPFASVFDKSSVDMLERLNCPAYKIASFELCDIPLIEYVAQTGKPMILSTGMASDQDIWEADDAINLSVPRMFLHCVSGYPTPPEEANLSRIPYLRSKLVLPIGFSDHTLGHTVTVAAVALGACLIEKHLCLEDAEGPDSGFSLEPAEFLQMVHETRLTYSACAGGQSPSEQASVGFRRSLYAVQDIQEGERLSAENIRSIRPGGGLAPSLYGRILGAKACRTILRGDPLSLDDLSMGQS